MGDALLRNAQRFPTKLALDDGRLKRTYLDLQLRTNRLGNYFLQQGICPGDHVAVSCGNRAETLKSFLLWPKSVLRQFPSITIGAARNPMRCSNFLRQKHSSSKNDTRQGTLPIWYSTA